MEIKIKSESGIVPAYETAGSAGEADGGRRDCQAGDQLFSGGGSIGQY